MPNLKTGGKYTDMELVALVAQGKSLYFNEIMNRHKDIVAKTISAMIGNVDDAQDIGQEVFIRFYKSIEKFRGESKLSTYLVRIAINLSLNHIRKTKKRRLLSIFKDDSGELVLGAEAIEVNSESDDNNEVIILALKQLDEVSRAVLTLRLVDGFSVKETAEMLEMPLGTVLSKQSRAQDKLRTILKNYI